MASIVFFFLFFFFFLFGRETVRLKCIALFRHIRGYESKLLPPPPPPPTPEDPHTHT